MDVVMIFLGQKCQQLNTMVGYVVGVIKLEIRIEE